MKFFLRFFAEMSQCTYRCVVLPDSFLLPSLLPSLLSSSPMSQCTYRCVVLPDERWPWPSALRCGRLNAPTGAWCSLTQGACGAARSTSCRLNAPTGAWCSLTDPRASSLDYREESQCTYRCVVLPDALLAWSRESSRSCLNAPTGAWCSLTPALGSGGMTPLRGPGAPPAPGAPLRTGQHRTQTST